MTMFFVVVVVLFCFPEGGGEEEEEEKREGYCTWAGEDSLGPGFSNLWDSFFICNLV